MPALKPASRPDHVLVFLLAVVLGLAGCASTPGDGENSQAIERKPVEPLSPEQEVELARALNFVRSQQYAGAIDILQGLQAQRPAMGRIDARIGWVLQQQGRQEEAEAAYRRALEKAPGEPMACNNLALIRQKHGDFDQAKQFFAAGLRAHPDTPALHYNLAVLAELYLLDLPLALKHYRRFQALTDGREEQVAGWIADLERRVN